MKNKKILLKIFAVVLCISVLLSVFAVSSSASNIMPQDPLAVNRHVIPHFNPIGFTGRNVFGNELESYNVNYGGDFYAEIESDWTSLGFASRVSFFDYPSQTWFNLDRYNDIKYIEAPAGPGNVAFPSGYYTWGSQFYQSSVSNYMYIPNHSWDFDDFVYMKDIPYMIPFIRLTFLNNGYQPEVVYSYCFFDITYYDKDVNQILTVHHAEPTMGKFKVDATTLEVTLDLIKHEYIDKTLDDYDVDIAYISNYRIVYYAPGYTSDGSDATPKVDRIFLGQLIDDLGYYPDVEDFDNYNLIRFKESGEYPEPVDVSSWLITGVAGFLNTPLFGSISIGMIFVSILGLWFMVVFLKKFAGG